MIAVLGAGMAGFGAAYRLRQEKLPCLVYDMKSHPGGHTSSYADASGFVFDEGPHISFTKDKRIQDLFAANVDGEYEVIHSRVNNYWKGLWLKHPVQCNLHGLPDDLVVEILCGMTDAHYREQGTSRTYEDWLVASYGRKFAETFPMQYGRKYHTTDARNMSTEWLGPRLYRPKLQEVFRGAIAETTPDVHYISDFRYPTRGGFVSYLRPFFACTDIRVGHKVERIDPVRHEIAFANGVHVRYDQLISSLPLPELVRRISGVPADVREAAGRLACSTCVIVNIGLAREDVSDWHWTYFYDDDFCFSRVSCPHLLSKQNAPAGSGSIQAEVYFSDKYKPLDRAPEAWIEPVLADLRRCGLVREDDRVVFKSALLARYANVIFDLERAAAVEIIHGYLDDVGIAYCGRYGEWGYHWTDESFISGENAAQKLLDAAVTGKRV